MFYIFWGITAVFAVVIGIWAGGLIDRRESQDEKSDQ